MERRGQASPYLPPKSPATIRAVAMTFLLPLAIGGPIAIGGLVAIGGLGPWEIALILLVVLLVFGAKRIPEIARGLGKGIREFKDATNEISKELQSEPPRQQVQPPPQQTYQQPTYAPPPQQQANQQQAPPQQVPPQRPPAQQPGSQS